MDGLEHKAVHFDKGVHSNALMPRHDQECLFNVYMNPYPKEHIWQMLESRTRSCSSINNLTCIQNKNSPMSKGPALMYALLQGRFE